MTRPYGSIDIHHQKKSEKQYIHQTLPESVNSALRKVTNGKGAFTTPESVYKLLYLRIEELHQKWNKPIPNWSKIQLQLIEIYEERYIKYLNI